MPVSLSVVAAKDGAASPAQIAGGGLQAQDKSGTGAGPFTLGHVMIDGLAGTNMAAVTAANAVKVDGSAVTQPVSIATAPVLVAGSAIIGKVGVDQTTDGTTNKVAADLRIAGTAIDKGSGTGGTATPRVILDASQLDPVVAHDSVDSGSPYKQGFRAVTSLSGLTLVSAADRTDGFAGVDGVQIIRPHCNLEDVVSGRATDTAGTSTSCIASSGAGIKTYLTSVALANSSATAVTVNILDGASVKYTLSVPAGSGNNKEFTVPLPGTAATAWNFQTSAAATTVTCSMIGFKSKV